MKGIKRHGSKPVTGPSTHSLTGHESSLIKISNFSNACFYELVQWYM